MNNKDLYLDKVCKYIKYQSVHKNIREELSEHIEEAVNDYNSKGYAHNKAIELSLKDMGDPKRIGEAFNKQYRMFFNSKYGLIIWSGLATCFIYFILYPVICAVGNGISGESKPIIMMLILIAFIVINYLILKRGHLMISGRDVKDITLGFLCGIVFSLGVLFLLSATNKFGYYIYCPSIKILFFNSIYYMGGNHRFCGDELLIWLSSIAVYMLSCKINGNAKGLEAAVKLDSVYPYYINIDKDAKFRNQWVSIL